MQRRFAGREVKWQGVARLPVLAHAEMDLTQGGAEGQRNAEGASYEN